MKDPDTAYDAVEDAVKESVANLNHLTESEKEAIIGVRQKEIWDKVGQWFEYGEYLTVEVDTETNTCVVVKKNG